ncbi:hypothetical protein [Curtobacterium sp. VKM Ac-1395]|uniref:hypothetical protein n=1 Tax=Curtobacterium sp. VKM Ac-1395 TaxID=2783815 RepID=UPI00188D6501|nr:hypothetical protein [Curtobacterium sp. VKM Ac-1395]MBF4588934.1 hypothetical protein [Curtobacterium sp. VKM Ac-1395]
MHAQHASGNEGRHRWTNPLTDGWEYRWNVLVALPDCHPAMLDAVLASVGASQANTVVQLSAGSRTPATEPSRNLVYAVDEALPELLEGVDVAVVSGDALTALAAAQHRVPVVVFPASDAQVAVGEALASVGAGVVVRSAAEVGQAIRAIASDGSRGPRMRGLARQLGAVTVLLAALGTSALRLVVCTRAR